MSLTRALSLAAALCALAGAPQAFAETVTVPKPIGPAAPGPAGPDATTPPEIPAKPAKPGQDGVITPPADISRMPVMKPRLPSRMPVIPPASTPGGTAPDGTKIIPK